MPPFSLRPFSEQTHTKDNVPNYCLTRIHKSVSHLFFSTDLNTYTTTMRVKKSGNFGMESFFKILSLRNY